MTFNLESLVSATDLNRGSGQILARAAAGDRIVVLSQNRPLAAIVSIADFRRLQELDQAPLVANADRGAAPAVSGAPGTVTIGYLPSGEPLALALSCNTLIAGQTGSGKSVTMSAVLACAVDDERAPAQFWAWSRGDSGPMIVHRSVGRRPMVSTVVHGGYEDDPAAAHRFMSEVLDERARRQALLRDVGAASIAEVRERGAGEGPPIPDVIVVLDELPHASGDGDDWWSFLSTLMSDGDQLEIYVWLTSQEGAASRSVFARGELAARFQQRIVHRLRDFRISKAFVGVEGSALARSLGVGQAVVQQFDGAPRLVTISGPDQDPEELAPTSTE